MRSFLICVVALALPALLSAQGISGDSLLRNERTIDRPITLHARQFRVTGAYALSILSARFNPDGERIAMKEEGLSGIRHNFALDLKYGVHEYIQVNAAISQTRSVVREDAKVIGTADAGPVISQEVSHKYAGLEDLYIGVDLRAPLKTRKLDLAVTLGMLVPVTTNDPRQPEHSFRVVERDGMSVHDYQYRYNDRVGKGIPVAAVGAMIKYRSHKWAVSGRVEYQHALKDGESFEWRHQLKEDSKFEYREDPFAYRLSELSAYYVEFEYQTGPRFCVFIDASGDNSFNGWHSDQPDLKVATPYTWALVASSGFEMIVTPRLWIRQRIGFPATGQNHEAPLSFRTTLMYNFFQ